MGLFTVLYRTEIDSNRFEFSPSTIKTDHIMLMAANAIKSVVLLRYAIYFIVSKN